VPVCSTQTSNRNVGHPKKNKQKLITALIACSTVTSSFDNKFSVATFSTPIFGAVHVGILIIASNSPVHLYVINQSISNKKHVLWEKLRETIQIQIRFIYIYRRGINERNSKNISKEMKVQHANRP
jgi:hypothetical protein